MNPVLFCGERVFPSKVVCIGRNYVDHIRELDNEVPDEPVLFIKPNSAIGAAPVHHVSHNTHYEGEIALLVRAGEVAGVGFGLDLTRRDVQSVLKAGGLPWERAKAFDGAAVFGGFVAYDGDLAALHMTLTINAKRVQAGGYALMLHKPDAILREISSLFTLEDNDIVMTGTPAGVGELVAGDVFCGSIYAGDELLVESTWTVR
jgi:2-keto-4-pentenoate hydratase/2-oxohepta-3-ene-1,7-dioic acid hydratase in catechol pathway